MRWNAVPARTKRRSLKCRSFELMDAVDELSFRTPVRDIDKPFLMPVEDVCSDITGRGTVVHGP